MTKCTMNYSKRPMRNPVRSLLLCARSWIIAAAKSKPYALLLSALALVFQVAIAPLTIRHLLQEQEKFGQTRDVSVARMDLARELAHTWRICKMVTASLAAALYLVAIKLYVLFRGLFGTL